jgi:predicted aspartyl protease
MEVTYKGKTLLLKRVLVDTGSGSTIIKTDLAESIGIVGRRKRYDLSYQRCWGIRVCVFKND